MAAQPADTDPVPSTVPAPTSQHASATSAASTRASVPERGSLQTETARLLWFAAGAASTALGVWMGSHWLR